MPLPTRPPFHFYEETRTMPIPPTYLTLEQAARSAALEKARAILESRNFVGATPPADPGDIVAVARFILDGEDLYEGEDDVAVVSNIVSVAPGHVVGGEATRLEPKVGEVFELLPDATMRDDAGETYSAFLNAPSIPRRSAS